jgi:phosphatidylserine decarboxylase
MASINRCANFRVATKGPTRIPVALPRTQRVAQWQKVRGFTSSPKYYQKRSEYKESFGTRLRRALGETKIKWYPIPVGVGIGFLGLAQLYRINNRENAKRREEDRENDGYVYTKGEGENGNREGKPRRRERIRPTGPWCVLQMAPVSGRRGLISF